MKKYCKSLEDGKAPVEDFESLSAEQVNLEKVSLGLRTIYGIRREDLLGIIGALENLQKLEASGHVKIKGDRIIPTKKGLLVADQLPLNILSKG